MRVIASLRSVLSALFRRSVVENEVEEELRAHIQDRANDLERSGIPRAEAERRARASFGSVAVARERFNLRGRILWLNVLTVVSAATAKRHSGFRVRKNTSGKNT